MKRGGRVSAYVQWAWECGDWVDGACGAELIMAGEGLRGGVGLGAQGRGLERVGGACWGGTWQGAWLRLGRACSPGVCQGRVGGAC